MSIFYCAETGGFYLPGMQPAGLHCVAISKAAHAELRAQNAAGKIISADADGAPIAIDPPPATLDQMASKERAWRDVQLAEAATMRDRHRDQVEINAETTLSPEQFKELLVHMQVLRDWPQSPDFPATEHRPVPPAWFADQTE